MTKQELIDQFERTHGRKPTRVELLALTEDDTPTGAGPTEVAERAQALTDDYRETLATKVTPTTDPTSRPAVPPQEAGLQHDHEEETQVLSAAEVEAIRRHHQQATTDQRPIHEKREVDPTQPVHGPATREKKPDQSGKKGETAVQLKRWMQGPYRGWKWAILGLVVVNALILLTTQGHLIKQSAPAASSSSESAKVGQTTPVWSDAQTEKLDTVMDDWAKTTGDPYLRYFSGSDATIKIDGNDYPEILTTENVRVDGQKVTMDLTADGTGKQDYQVVAVYSDGTHVYICAIRNERPVVLATQTGESKAGQANLQPTRSTDVQQGFSKIYQEK